MPTMSELSDYTGVAAKNAKDDQVQRRPTYGEFALFLTIAPLFVPFVPFVFFVAVFRSASSGSKLHSFACVSIL